jgi:hypothetical protein
MVRPQVEEKLPVFMVAAGPLGLRFARRANLENSRVPNAVAQRSTAYPVGGHSIMIQNLRICEIALIGYSKTFPEGCGVDSLYGKRV